jgi:hypothetical protein
MVFLLSGGVASRFLSSKYISIFLHLKNVRAWPENKNPH